MRASLVNDNEIISPLDRNNAWVGSAAILVAEGVDKMNENFRQFLDRLRQAGELVVLHQPVDIRHISTLVDQAQTALFFHNVIGYDMPVVSGIIRSRERAALALGCADYRDIEFKLKAAIDQPILPRHVKTSPTREVTLLGDE